MIGVRRHCGEAITHPIALAVLAFLFTGLVLLGQASAAGLA